MRRGKIERLVVTRGAPCGATWSAAAKVTGMPVEEAVVRIGLEVQFFCVADPAGWDPIHGKSPVHFAGKVHSAALREALRAGEGGDQKSEDGDQESEVGGRKPEEG